MVAELGDLARVLDQANREDLAELYKALGRRLRTRTHKRGLMLISPRRSCCVRGGHAP
jgi:hypothetical protein